MQKLAAFYSILMPGVGQIFNRQLIKGLIFIILEHFDNIMGHINQAIYLDFNGFHSEVIPTLNFQYAMFYPGFYAYTVWDALTKGDNYQNKPVAILFLIAGFCGELLTIFAPHLPIPTLCIALVMLVPMVIGITIFKPEQSSL